MTILQCHRTMKKDFFHLNEEKIEIMKEDYKQQKMKMKIKAHAVFKNFKESATFIPQEVFIPKDDEDEEFIQSFEKDVVHGMPESNEDNREKQRKHDEEVIKLIKEKLMKLKKYQKDKERNHLNFI